MDDYLTTEEVASMCRVGAETVRIWLRSGILPGRHVGQRWLVARADVETKLKGGDDRGSEQASTSASVGDYPASSGGRSISASASRSVGIRIIG